MSDYTPGPLPEPTIRWNGTVGMWRSDAHYNGQWMVAFPPKNKTHEGLFTGTQMRDYAAAEVARAVAAERERWAAAFTEARDAVLQDRGPLEAAGMDADKTNAVLAVLDDAFAGLC
jgi:hypothetical protein